MSIFDWFKKVESEDNKTKITRRSPAPVDWTDSMQVNAELTKGLYHNTYPGIKLGGALAYNPIAIPASLMGLPIPRVEEEQAQVILNEIVDLMTDAMKDIHIQSHREGTVWIWPKFTPDGLIWEFIPDASVTDIIRDLSTGNVIRIQTNEDITVSTGSGNTVTVNRQRTFTRSRVTIEYSGPVPADIKGANYRNTSGIIPIPFSNNADGDEIRGHSDYERFVTDLKSYHDIDLAEQTALAKFLPKMVQNMKNVDDWLSNNGYSSIADIDLCTIDLILNMPGESTEFVFPERMTESMQNKLKQIFHKIAESSGIPEIAWGLKTQGNLASVEENMAMLMNFVKDKQDQKTEPYKELFKASLRLMNKAYLVDTVPDIEIAWNRLDGLSDKTKSEIFTSFCDGISKAIGAAALTTNQLWRLWKINYPDATEEDYTEFEAGIARMVAHTASTKSNILDVLGTTGAV